MSHVAEQPQLHQEELATTTVSQNGQSVQQRAQEVYRVAMEMYRQKPDWVTFFREILGVEGVVRKLFQSQEELTSFEKTPEYDELQHMLAKLREKNSNHCEPKEPTRVITVRLPKSLHEALRAEAHGRNTSMNKLCISKLLQVIDDGLIPSH